MPFTLQAYLKMHLDEYFVTKDEVGYLIFYGSNEVEEYRFVRITGKSLLEWLHVYGNRSRFGADLSTPIMIDCTGQLCYVADATGWLPLLRMVDKQVCDIAHLSGVRDRHE